jgi:hypothetical protein
MYIGQAGEKIANFMISKEQDLTVGGN